MKMLTQALDFCWMVNGRSGEVGCMVVLWICPACGRTPELDLNWWYTKGGGEGSGWWRAACGAQYVWEHAWGYGFGMDLDLGCPDLSCPDLSCPFVHWRRRIVSFVFPDGVIIILKK